MEKAKEKSVDELYELINKQHSLTDTSIIQSKKPWLKHIFNPFKKIIKKMIMPIILPILAKQEELNSHFIQILNSLKDTSLVETHQQKNHSNDQFPEKKIDNDTYRGTVPKQMNAKCMDSNRIQDLVNILNEKHQKKEESNKANRESITKQYVVAAEDYYKKIDSYEHLKNRPYSSLEEAPVTFYRLGILLSELFLSPGQKIMDFGAGVCWLSKLLNKFGLSTISVDVSYTAISYGKHLFESDHTINWNVHPQFVTYNGFTLPFKNNSFDRIICYDALHHIENIEEILEEFYRILKEGGIAAFAEPGIEHSISAAAQFEMRNYGILEKDINVFDLIKISDKLGFKFFLLPYPLPGRIKFNPAQLENFFAHPDSYPFDIIKETVLHNNIFLLIKGDRIYDSLAPHILKADIKLVEPPEPFSIKPGEKIKLILNITNTGDTVWLCSSEYTKGRIQIGAHLLNKTDQFVKQDCFRHELPFDVLPGQNIVQEISILVPEDKEICTIAIDLVCEQITWFELAGSKIYKISIQKSS